MRITVRVRRAAATRQRWASWDVTIHLNGAHRATRSMLAQVDDEGRWWPYAEGPATAEGGDREPDPTGPSHPDPEGIEIRPWTRDILARTDNRRRTVNYGRYLFNALFGRAVWQDLWDSLTGADPVELVLNWPADDADLHRHVWELAHDGKEFLALRQDRVVAFVRTVGDAGPVPKTVTGVPRLLFVAGSALTDPRIHAGAEFIGLLQGLESMERREQRQRRGATVATRLLTEASPNRLSERCREFRPDLVHIVSHGRWDRVNGRGVVHLRSDNDAAKEDAVGAAQLLAALRSDDGELPLAVLLSVCDSGASPAGRGGGPGRPGTRPQHRESVNSEATAPFAALLVEAGVPLVVAMAGRVADSACRMFTRALAAAISKGLALSVAVANGRRAVSMGAVAARPDGGPGGDDDEEWDEGPTDNPVDWALPTLFASPELPPDFPLVDVAHARRVRQYITRLKFATTPVLCGREEYFDIHADLLNPHSDLCVLVATGTGGKTGGSRLLQELGASTLRAGHVPCYIGPFYGDAPKSSWWLARVTAEGIHAIRKRFDLDDTVPSELLQEVARRAHRDPADGSLLQLAATLYRVEEEETEETAIPPLALARLMQRDLRRLAADLGAGHPSLFESDPQVLLLLDDVDQYEGAIETVFRMLDATGLGLPDGRQLPVALFGRLDRPGSQQFADWVDRTPSYFPGSSEVSSVRLFRDMRYIDSNRDLLAYRQLMLHPEPDEQGPRKVLVPREASAEWVAHIRELADHSSVVYDPNLLRRMERYALDYRRQFHIGDDDAMLRLCGLAS